jgi:ankyrin repeat protein
MDTIARRDLRRLLIATVSFVPWVWVFFACNLPWIRPPTRLMEAVRLEWLQEVQALIAQGVDVNEKGAFGSTALSLAVDQMDLRLAKVLISAGANVNERRDSGTLLLIDAVRRSRAPERQREMVELLLASGADVRARSFEDGRTALHYATRAEVVRLLLAAGADVYAADCMANTPISRTVGAWLTCPRQTSS